MTREERLGAYLDGRLSADETEAMERALRDDPALADELRQMRETDELLRAALKNEIPDESDPATLARFGLGEADIVPLKRRAANENRPTLRWALPAGGAVAAALAIVLLRTPTITDPWAGAEFSSALDQTVSLQQASLKGATLVPRLTFQAADGRFCREFQLRSNHAEWNRDGIACRSDGRWTTEALVAAGKDRPAYSDSISLAGGEDNAALASAIEELGASAPLDGARERRLIDGGWARSK